MTSRRTARIARAIKEQVSTSVLFELRDPRIKGVTVLDVEVSPDIRSAKVYVSVMGSEKDQALTMHGLESARGFLQSRIADRIQTRWTPVLTFVLDQGVKKSIEASRILRQVMAEHGPPAADEELDQVDQEDGGTDSAFPADEVNAEQPHGS